jgi:uncharacterized protein VirK/YbjX
MWSNSEELFLLTDSLAGGKMQTMKRRLKFKLRQKLFSAELAQVKQYFESHQLTRLLEMDASLALKCTRAYLWTGLDGPQRVAAQLAFLDWFLARFKWAEVLSFYEKGSVSLAKIQHSDTDFEILLSPSRGLSREGELAVTLLMNGAVLLRSSASVLPAQMLGLSGDGHALFVGCLQGTSNTKDLVKQATQALERTKPTFILLNALQAMAQAWGLVGIVGVADKKHAYASYFSLSKRINIRYDDVWQQLGATQQTAQQDWLLPLVWVARPEHEVESKKRSALKRRNAMRQKFIEVCTQGLSQLGAAEDLAPLTDQVS